MTVTETACEVVELTSDEGIELFDSIARKNMGITGAEFVQRWNAGEFEGINWDDVPGLTSVATALPFAGI
ncbi:MAG: hypothetical protein ACRDDJ_15420 [[Mycobacterium] stephanolepidis]